MVPFLFSPFKDGMQKWLNQNTYGGEINKFVQDMISQSMSQTSNNNHVTEAMGIFNQEERKQENHSLNINTFETHDHVYVRVPIKDETQLSTIKIFHTSNQLMIEGFPSEDDKQVVTLPSIVRMKGSTSKFQDDCLQIRMVKRMDLPVTEIDVRN